MSRTVVEPSRVVQFVTDLLNPVMHYKRALSIGQAVVGTMHAGRLSSAAVGRALARVFDITPKSGIKQVDRLLGNQQFRPPNMPFGSRRNDGVRLSLLSGA